MIHNIIQSVPSVHIYVEVEQTHTDTYINSLCTRRVHIYVCEVPSHTYVVKIMLAIKNSNHSLEQKKKNSQVIPNEKKTKIFTKKKNKTNLYQYRVQKNIKFLTYRGMQKK
jgi:hypothetical protein